MNDLIQRISAEGFHNTKSILSSYNSDDWLQYITINPYHYHRKKVFENDDFEILIITWNTNQESQIHDHADNGCYMLLLQGQLEETIHTPIVTITHYHTPKSLSYIDNTIGLHKIKNPSPNNIAVSLHVYSPPNHIAKLLG